ncbi:MAG: hypothetical protein ACXVB4_16750 [Pseudobdellovibrionaceae bacterium]
MKIINLFIGTFLAVSIFGCGAGKESDLGIQVVGNTAYLINATAQSCANKVEVALSPSTAAPTSSVSAYYYSYQGATLSWKNTTDTAYIVEMKIEFTSANVTNTCTISGDELLGVFFNFTTNTKWNGTISPAPSAEAPTLLSSNCQIRCGGLRVADEKKTFTTVGTMTWIGFQRSPTTGEEKPIKATTTVKLTYL